MSKIVALLPVKNEEWIIPTYLSSLEKVVDEIIVLDDNSSDDTRKIFREHPNVTIYSNSETSVNMSHMRQKLLTYGRKHKGTHFVCLDADEAFSSNFINIARECILNLKPKQKLTLQWIALWKSMDKYRDDNSVWSNSYKDFAFADHPSLSYDASILSEPRTPGSNKDSNLQKISNLDGVVLHFQFSNWKYFQIKQAWYRCIEIINTNKTAQEINSIYSITLDRSDVNLSPVPKKWISDLQTPAVSPKNWRLSQIEKMFDQHGARYFQKLDLWHIKELKGEYVRRVGSSPHNHYDNLCNWLYLLYRKISPWKK